MSKKLIAVILTFAIFASFVVSVSAYTEGDEQDNFDSLPDNAIVCYVMDVPVYKYEIDENGYIHKNFADNEILMCASDGIQTGTLATKHKTEAKNVASAFNSSASKDYAIAQALGSYGKTVAKSSPYFAAVAAVVGGVAVLNAVSKETVANNLTGTVTSNNGAKLIHVNSKYGSFYNVSAWNGSTVYKPCTYASSNATITISSVYCSHGSVW